MHMRAAKRAGRLVSISEYEEERCASEARTDQTPSQGMFQFDNGRMGVLQ